MAVIGILEIIIAVFCFFILRSLVNTHGLPYNYPIVGMLPQLLLSVHRVHDWCTDLLEKSHCTFLWKGPWFTNMNLLFTADPANIHYIMSANFPNFPKGDEFKQIFDSLGEGIFNSDSDSWKNQRKVAQALFNHRRFYRLMVKTIRAKLEKGMIPILDEVAKKSVEVDLQDLFQRFTFDSTCIVVTGYDPECLSFDFPDVPFAKAVEVAEESVFNRHVLPECLWKLQRWLDIGQERKLRKAVEIANEIVFDYIQRKRDEMSAAIPKQEEVADEGVDLLTSYMNMMMDESQTLLKSDDQDSFLSDTVLNFLLAGRDTISSALTWFFYLVSKLPEVENKIRQEIMSILPEKKRGGKWLVDDTEIEDLNKLVYLNGAFCEALRLYPPVPFQHKAPLVTDKLPSGHDVVSGKTKIVISIYAMGKMKSIWGDDCLEFKPERWISENGEIKRHPSYKFLVFNAGPRTCLGKEMAFVHMRAVVACIIHNYKVEIVENHPHSLNASIVLGMKHGFPVRISSRRLEP